MNINIILVIGLFLMLLGTCMFLWGMHMFTYLGNYTRLMSVSGEYALLLFLPTFVIGAIATGIGIGRSVKQVKTVDTDTHKFN